MSALTRRATIYLQPDLFRVLRLKSAESSRSVSELVNEAVRHSLREDADDLDAFERRAKEPVISLESAIRELRKRGTI